MILSLIQLKPGTPKLQITTQPLSSTTYCLSAPLTSAICCKIISIAIWGRSNCPLLNSSSKLSISMNMVTTCLSCERYSIELWTIDTRADWCTNNSNILSKSSSSEKESSPECNDLGDRNNKESKLSSCSPKCLAEEVRESETLWNMSSVRSIQRSDKVIRDEEEWGVPPLWELEREERGDAPVKVRMTGDKNERLPVSPFKLEVSSNSELSSTDGSNSRPPGGTRDPYKHTISVSLDDSPPRLIL